jgi:probable HAF family extracellular repeat protein
MGMRLSGSRRLIFAITLVVLAAPGLASAHLLGEPAYTVTDLGTLGGDSSEATGINDLGQVVGYGGINEYGPLFREFTQAFLWQEGSMRSLGALDCPCSFNERYGTSAAYGINAAGQAVGDSTTVRGINESGEVVGESGAAGGAIARAFLWQDGVMRDLNGLIAPDSGWVLTGAAAINDAGQIVGAGLHEGRRRAFLLTPTAPSGGTGAFRRIR